MLSRDDSTGAQGWKRVVRLFRGETNQVVHLRIAKAASVQRGRSQRHRVGQGKGGSSSDGEEGSEPARPGADGEQTIRSTVGHPYFVVGRGWVHAEDLKLGDELSGSLGESLVVTGLEIRDEQAKHYNFEVEGFHTYFVSETEADPAVWVHNTGCEPGGSIYARAQAMGGVVDVPTHASGRFRAWFDSQSPAQIGRHFQTESVANKIKTGLRGDGGHHEFLMVAEAPRWKSWGVSARQVQDDFAIPISRLNEGGAARGWTHSTGIAGSSAPRSTTVHNELRRVIRASNSLAEFKANIRPWASRNMTEGFGGLPRGFHE